MCVCVCGFRSLLLTLVFQTCKSGAVKVKGAWESCESRLLLLQGQQLAAPSLPHVCFQTFISSYLTPAPSVQWRTHSCVDERVCFGLGARLSFVYLRTRTDARWETTGEGNRP